MEEKNLNENNINISIESDANPEEHLFSKTQDEHSHSHHHSHHSHHHSHKHKKRREKSKKLAKFKSFCRKNKKKLIGLVFLFLIVLVLILISVYRDKQNAEFEIPEETVAIVKQTDTTFEVKLPMFTNAVPVVHSAVIDYVNADGETPMSEIHELYKDHGRIDVHVPLRLSFMISGIPGEISFIGTDVYISEDKDFNDFDKYSLGKNDTFLDINYLKVNTEYFYRLVFKFSNGATNSSEGSFFTADTPRIISIEGVRNFRDIGGWILQDGRRIKQGMLYRGTELDGAIVERFCISKEGASVLTSILGVRTEMDLRYDVDCEGYPDALGENVEHICYGASSYDGIFTDDGRRSTYNIFKDLADERKYPVYLHCTYGKDRTGTICYILEALLGLSQFDLMREYELSALYYGDVDTVSMNAFLEAFEEIDGLTFQDKAENYLLSIGITNEEIESIRNILIEE